MEYAIIFFYMIFTQRGISQSLFLSAFAHFQRGSEGGLLYQAPGWVTLAVSHRGHLYIFPSLMPPHQMGSVAARFSHPGCDQSRSLQVVH
jgi:hypothetical protein